MGKAVRTTRPSRARAEVLGAKLDRLPVTTSLPVLPDDQPAALDVLAAELQGPVFALLDSHATPDGPVHAAALLAAYGVAATEALQEDLGAGRVPPDQIKRLLGILPKGRPMPLRMVSR